MSTNPTRQHGDDQAIIRQLRNDKEALARALEECRGMVGDANAEVDTLVAEAQAGRDLADSIRQYEDHLIGVGAALDTYRKTVRRERAAGQAAKAGQP